MNHGHAIDGMLAGDDVSARALRLHLDNSHDERTTGWDFARLHALHQELHGPRLAEIEAAANLIAERLAAAEPAVVEAVVGRRTCVEGGMHSGWAGVCDTCGSSLWADLADTDAIARGAELARAFNAAGRPEMSEAPAFSGTAGGVAASLGAAPPAPFETEEETPKVVDLMAALEASLAAAKAKRPFEHVWTCRLQAGDDTCECEEYARS